MSEVKKAEYSASLNVSSRSLRDAFMKSFNQNYVIGKLYTRTGDVLYGGQTVTEWMGSFKVVDLKGVSNLNIETVKSIFIKLMEATHRAASFHANLFAAAESLRSIIEEKETAFIDAELKKYRRDGEYFNRELGKPTQKQPGKEVLEKSAQQTTAELRSGLRNLKMEVDFFEHMLSDLESQRRILKDYSELLRIDIGTFGRS